MTTATTPGLAERLGDARSRLVQKLHAGTEKQRAVALLVLVLGVGVPLITWRDDWPFVVIGVASGAIYSLAALGLVLIYKTSGVFNFAIGAQAAASAYVFYSLKVDLGMPWPIAAILTVVGVGLGGSLVLERIAYWLAGAPAIMQVVASVGILVALQAGLTGAYGYATIPFDQFLPTNGVRIGGVNVLASQIIVIAIALAATIGLALFFRRARLGVAMDAVVDDPSLLSLMATDPFRVRRVAWAIGSSFVSISGMLIAPVLGIDVNTMLLLYVTAFGAAAAAAFTSIPQTFAWSIAIGVMANVASAELGGSSNRVIASLYNQIPFLVLVIALLVVPRRKLVARGLSGARRIRPIKSYSARVNATGAGVAVVGGCLLPFLVPSFYLNQYSSGLAFAIIFASLALLVWTSGQISLCQMAFASVGASTFAHAQDAGLPWLVAIVIAVLVTIPVGAIVSIPSFRLSGVYLAVATFGFGLLFQNLLYTTYLMFGPFNSVQVSRPSVGGDPLSDKGYYYLTLAFFGVVSAVVVAVRRSRIGRLLRAVSESPAALEAHGVDVRQTRLIVFCISGGIAALGGALLSGVTGSAGGDATGPYGFFNSIAMIAVLAFCGRRPIASPLVAAFIFEVMKIYSPFSNATVVQYQGVAFGLLAVAVAVLPGVKLSALSTRTTEREGMARPARSPAVLTTARGSA